jgi:CheY-like chemotaxis protein
MYILLVDDDVRSAFALTGMLERQGGAVGHAEDIGEALQRLAEGRRVSALLIDADLLASGSEELVLRLLSRCAQLPIIAMTPSTSGEDERESSGAVRDRPRVLPPEVHRLQRPVEAAALASVLRTVAARVKTH